MRTFLEHSQFELTESLNTPQEYYMTDDTKMPNSIYAAFDVNGNNYIMSLQQTSDAGVYILEVGKTGATGGKTYWWKFHTPKDILPVLATTMHFMQSATSWLGPKLKGVAVQFKQGASDQMTRSAKLAERIIKRSYIKSFTVVPVAQPAITSKDKYYHQKVRFLFISKKGVSTSTLFGGKTFKKYDFSGKEAPAEAIAELSPKKMPKLTNTLKPSTKFSFGQFNIDTPQDTDILTKAQDLKAVDATPEENPASSYTAELEKIGGPLTGIDDMVAAVEALPAFKPMVAALAKDGYDESKVHWANLKHVINKMTQAEKDVLGSMMLLNVDSAGSQSTWKAVMQRIASPLKNPIIDKQKAKMAKAVKDFTSKYNNTSASTAKSPTAQKSTVNPNEIVATMPGSGIVIEFDQNGFKEVDGDFYKKKSFIKEELGYHNAVQDLTMLSNVMAYSGSNYSKYNNPLRATVGKLFRGEQLSSKEIKSITGYATKYQKLFRAFDKLKPLPESLWVYRGTYLPAESKDKLVPGYEYVDPAFLSTSLKDTINFGKIRMRIFLPKGSKIVPILDHSYHTNENEILLPPSSVIKIVEVAEAGDKTGVQGIFMGSAFKSVNAMLKKQLTMMEDQDSINQLRGFMTMYEEDEKQEPYEPEGKFAGEYDDDLAELMSSAIASGKLKVESPEDD